MLSEPSSRALQPYLGQPQPGLRRDLVMQVFSDLISRPLEPGHRNERPRPFPVGGASAAAASGVHQDVKHVIASRTRLNDREQIPVPPVPPRTSEVELEVLFLPVDLLDTEHQRTQRQTFTEDRLLSSFAEGHALTLVVRGDGVEV